MNKNAVKLGARRTVASESISQPFAHLQWVDLMSPADLKFWAGSPLGSAILASRFRGQGFEPGKRVKARQRGKSARQPANFGTVEAVRYPVSGDEFIPHAPKVKAAKGSADRLLCSEAGRGDVRRGAVVSGGSFDVPLFETRADATRGEQARDTIRQFIDVISMQAAARAVRTVESRSGKEFSEGMRDEALAESSAAVVKELRGVSRSWEGVERFVRPAFADRTLVSERKRRTYFWCVAYRAAFRTLTANPSGMTGRKGSVQVVELEQAEAIPARIDEQAIEERGRSDYRAARQLVWEKLGCIWGIPRMIGNAFNIAQAARAARRRWRLLLLLLRGVPATVAVHRCGFGESFVRNGQLARVLASVGVCSATGFVI